MRGSFEGVLVATTTPFGDDGAVALDVYAAHCAWLLDGGCAGLVPNGSLGEYRSLRDGERAAVVEAAVAAAEPRGAVVVPGVSANDWPDACRWAQQAADAGADGVMVLPPTGHRASHAEVLRHFREVASVGLPVVAYNNPFDTRVDLVPDLLAQLAAIPGIVAVKEFSGDVRRVAAIRDRAPQLQVICGADDVALESFLAGATGWIAGFANAFPAASVRLYELGVAGDVRAALPLYAELLPAFRWDAGPAFVQAIKLAIDLVGRHGGAVRPPRLPLEPDEEKACRADVERALAAAG